MKNLKIAGFDSSSINAIVWEWMFGFNAMGHEAHNYNLTNQSILSCMNREYDLVITVGQINPWEFELFRKNSPNCKIAYFTDAWQPFLSDFKGLISFVGTLQSDAPALKNKCISEGFAFDYVPLCGNEFLFYPIECEKEYSVGFVGGLAHGSRGEEKYLYPILDNPKYKCFLGGMTYKGFGIPNIPYERVNFYRNQMRVSLNFHTAYQKNPGVRQDCNQSLYNIAMSGVLQICDHPLAKELFRGSVVVPDDKDWLDSVEYYVNNPEEGQKLAKKAREIALQEHSLEVRLNQLLEKLCLIA